LPRSNEDLLQQLHLPALNTRIIIFLCCQKLQAACYQGTVTSIIVVISVLLTVT